MDHDQLMRTSYLGEWGQRELADRQAYLEELQNQRQSLILEGETPSQSLQEAIHDAEIRLGIFELAIQEIREKYGELTPADLEAIEQEAQNVKNRAQLEQEREQQELEAGQQWAAAGVKELPDEHVSPMDEKALEDPSVKGWVYPPLLPGHACNFIYGVKKPVIRGFEDLTPKQGPVIDNFTQTLPKITARLTFIRNIIAWFTTAPGEVAYDCQCGHARLYQTGEEDTRCHQPAYDPKLGRMLVPMFWDEQLKAWSAVWLETDTSADTSAEDDLLLDQLGVERDAERRWLAENWGARFSNSPGPRILRGKLIPTGAADELRDLYPEHQQGLCPGKHTGDILKCLFCLSEYQATDQTSRESRIHGFYTPEQLQLHTSFIRKCLLPYRGVEGIGPLNPMFLDPSQKTIVGFSWPVISFNPENIIWYINPICAANMLRKTYKNAIRGHIGISQQEFGHLVRLPRGDNILPTLFGSAVTAIVKEDGCPDIVIKNRRKLPQKVLKKLRKRRRPRRRRRPNPDIITPGDDIPFIWRSVEPRPSCYHIALSPPSQTKLGPWSEVPVDFKAIKKVVDLEHWKPTPAEMRGWEQVLPFPEDIKVHIENPDDAWMAVGEYIKNNFYYVCHDEIGRWFRECDKEMPLLVSTLKMGHCDVLSWAAAAYMRQLGVPALVVSEYVYKTTRAQVNGKREKIGSFKAANTHARVVFLDSKNTLRFFDPTLVVPRPRSHYLGRLPSTRVAEYIQDFKRRRKLETKRRVLQQFLDEFPPATLGGTDLYRQAGSSYYTSAGHYKFPDEATKQLFHEAGRHSTALRNYRSSAVSCRNELVFPHDIEPWGPKEVYINAFDESASVRSRRSGDESYNCKRKPNSILRYYQGAHRYPRFTRAIRRFKNYWDRKNLSQIHSFIKSHNIVVSSDWLHSLPSIHHLVGYRGKPAQLHYQTLMSDQNSILFPEIFERFYSGMSDARQVLLLSSRELNENLAYLKSFRTTLDESPDYGMRLIPDCRFSNRFRKIISHLTENPDAMLADLEDYVDITNSKTLKNLMLMAMMFGRLVVKSTRDTSLRQQLMQNFNWSLQEYRNWVVSYGDNLGEGNISYLTRVRSEVEYKRVRFQKREENVSAHHRPRSYYVAQYKEIFYAPNTVQHKNIKAAQKLINLASGTVRKKLPESIEWREYQPGDPVKRIDWLVSARHDTLITRAPALGKEPDSPLHVYFEVMDTVAILRYHAVVTMLQQLQKQAGHREIYVTAKFLPYIRLRANHDPFVLAKQLMFNEDNTSLYTGLATSSGMPNLIYLCDSEPLAAARQYLLRSKHRSTVCSTFKDAGFVYDDVRPEWVRDGFKSKRKMRRYTS